MKKLLALFILSTSLALHGAGCGSCHARALANRQTLKQAFPKIVAEVDALEAVATSFESGNFEKFLERQHKIYMAAVKEPRYQSILSHKNHYRLKSQRHYFGIPSLFFFPSLSTEDLDLMIARSEKLNNLLEEHPNSYVAPLINGMNLCQLSTKQLEALSSLHEIQTQQQKSASDFDKALVRIENKFFLLQQLLMPNSMRNGTSMEQAGQHVMILEMEMVKQMHAACVRVGDEERAEQFATLQAMIVPLTQYLKWENALQRNAWNCYKEPGKIEQQLVNIQTAYMKEKATLARNNRNLANYR